MSLVNPLVKSAAGFLAPPGPNARLTVMIFHRVVPQWDPLRPWEPDAEQFRTKMCWVAEWFNVLPLNEAVARLEARTLPSRPLAITFDDGYTDNLTVAGPILK